MCRLTALAKATCSNSRAEFYHSGAYLNGSWTWLVMTQLTLSSHPLLMLCMHSVVVVQWRIKQEDASQSLCKYVCSLITQSSSIVFALFLRAVRMLGYREDIDLERELHNVYKMYLAGQTTLVKMKG